MKRVFPWFFVLSIIAAPSARAVPDFVSNGTFSGMGLSGLAPISDVDEAGQPRVVVIFSASYGGGHDASAEAIKAELLKAYPRLRVEILYGQNYIRMASHFPRISELSTRFFDMVYQRAPKGYDRVYDVAVKTADNKSSAGDIPTHLFSSSHILADLERLRPDAIYSTFHIATSMLIAMREDGRLNPDIPIAWLDTDFVQKPFYYLHSLGVDQTFIAHPALREERLALGVPAEKMVTTGLFINPFAFERFSDEERRQFMANAMSVPDRAEGEKVGDAWEPTRQIWINGRMQDVSNPAVNLDPDVMTVIIASGRAGVGNYPVIIKGLVREARRRRQKIQIIAVCGDSEKNYDGVRALYERMVRYGDSGDVTLVASRLVDNNKLMKLVRSSQMFIGKSGSQSPFEAAVMGVPRILIDVIGGQERHTANFFKRLGLAEVVMAREQNGLAARAFAYLEDSGRMEQMRVADQVIRESYDLRPIPQFFADAISRRSGKPPVRPPGVPRSAVARACAKLLGRASRAFTTKRP